MASKPTAASFRKNEASGTAVFSGPKGHILMAYDTSQGKWSTVLFTEDTSQAEEYLKR